MRRYWWLWRGSGNGACRKGNTMKWLVTLSLGGMIAVSGQALAAPPAHAVQLRVSYAGLDIHSRDGARLLLGRLEQAAEAVCGTEPTPLDIEGTHAYHACRDTALKNAVAAVGSPELAALYDGRPDMKRIAGIR